MWTCSEKSEAASDGFEVKRCGSADVSVKVTLALSGGPDRFQLSDELAALLGVKVDTRPRIIAALWQVQDAPPSCVRPAGTLIKLPAP